MSPVDRDIVVAVTGASGAAYAESLMAALRPLPVRVHLVVSPHGQDLLARELGAGVSLAQGPRVTQYAHGDVSAPLASGSFRHQGMVVIPCSGSTLGSIAHGLADNLVCRAAAVTLKERRRLILCHRETPLSPIDVGNYKVLSDAGAIILPLSPGFYHKPTSLADLADFITARVLDLLDIPHSVGRRWAP